MMKNKVRAISILSVVVIVLFLYLLLGGCFHNNKKMLKGINLNDYKGYDNLMIVAHPDDETLWGFNELDNKKFLVVCVTCGRNKTREKEIENAMKMTNDKLISLGYTDKFMKRRSKWNFSYKNIKYDLKTIINLKKWDNIVTHNKDGEYGHMHHKMVHNMVYDIKPKHLSSFGKYYTKRKIQKLDPKVLEKYRLNEKTLKHKEQVLTRYKSQKKVKDMFSHMIPYENIDI